MQSRYNFMTEGSVKDEVSGNFYPDPLSLNYLKMDVPSNYNIEYSISEKNILFFWKMVSKYYGKYELDDIVLMVNNIPHINLLHEGEDIIIPSEDDIQFTYSKDRSV